jgi:flavin reductase (DIM6/NTAB) family NADH-FMN oxidoreductase RutF
MRPSSCGRTASGRVLWRIGSPPPAELAPSSNSFLSTLVPRTLAWFSVDDEQVALLDGFSGASYTPPTIFFGSGSLPADMLRKLKETRVCTVSSVTLHDPPASYLVAATHDGESPKAFSFKELGLESVKKTNNDASSYPVAVASSPVQMLCSLENCVELGNGTDLVVLVVETFHVDASVLSPPTEQMTAGRDALAKIDAELIRPILSLGNGEFACLKELRSMPRPEMVAEGNWTSSSLEPIPQTCLGKGNYESMNWSFREHGSKCPLGYNAETALIMPRVIGWISTYKSDNRTLHVAPYSFFTDVSRRDDCPMVAFSGYRKNGTVPKDAQKDTQETGAFGFNVVTEDLAVAMNYSAAPLGPYESEFGLAKLEAVQGDVMDVPLVLDSPMHYECEYFQTVDIGDFSIVVGKVRAVSINRSVLTGGRVDAGKMKPITRLGYLDEYGVHGSLSNEYSSKA